MWRVRSIAAVGLGTILGLILATAQVHGGEAPDPVKKVVVPRRPDLTMSDQPGGGGTERPAAPDLYLVEKAEGGWLRVKTRRGPGWVAAEKVVAADEAVAFFSEAIAKNRRDAFAFAMRGKVLLLIRNDPSHAMDDANDAIQADPREPIGYAVRGTIAFVRGDLDRAIADASEVVRLRPGDASALTSRAGLYLVRQEPDRAIADCEAALRLDPNDAGAYSIRASARLGRKDIPGAIADFSEAIRINPDNHEAYAGRATALALAEAQEGATAGALRDLPAQGADGREKSRHDPVISDFDTAVRLEPRNPAVYLSRALFLRDRGDLAGAIQDCDSAIALAPASPDGYAIRAGLHAERREHDQAIDDFSHVIQLDPSNSWAYTNRGLGWFEKKEFEKALIDLNRAVRLDPGNPSAYTSRGMVWHEKHEPDKALADLNRASQLDPDSPDVLNAEAWVRATSLDAKHRDGKLAISLARRAGERTEWKEPGILDTMAAACAEAGDFDDAVKWQTQANALFNDGPEKIEGEQRLKLYQARTAYHQAP